MTPTRLNEIATQFNGAYRGDLWSITLTGDELVDIVDLALDGLTLRQMEENEMNRDYFTKPIQGSRSQHDYGRTGPVEPMEQSDGGSAFLMILGAAIGGFVLALMFFAWIG